MKIGEKLESNKEKKHGRDFLLDEVAERIGELSKKRERRWISEEEYKRERMKLDEEQLEILTNPD